MKRAFLLILTLGLFPSHWTPAWGADGAATPSSELGTLRRIEVAGRLALAGERLRRDTCVYGITAEGFMSILRNAEDLNYYIWALREGSLEEGILPMTHAKVLKKIEAAEPFAAQASVFFSAEHSALLETLAKKTASIGKALDTQARFSVPDPTKSKLATLAARQAQDLAGIGADLCEGLRLKDMEGNLSAIQKKLFRYSMISAALARGNEDKQISPPPTDQIAAQMVMIDTQWAEILPLLEAGIAQNGLPLSRYKQIQDQINRLLTDYDFALYLYGKL